MKNYKEKLKTSFKFLVFVFTFSFLLFNLAPVAQAIDIPGLPIVQCGLSQDNPATSDINETKPCGRCDLFKLLNNIINFITGGLMPPVAVLLFVWAGFLILLGGANTNLVAQGRQIFTTTFYGIIIMLAAWMITNTLILSVGAKYNNAQNWWQFTCVEPAPVVPPVVRPPVVSPICSNSQQLAQQNNAPFPRRNAPELDQLISCIKSNMPGQNLGSEFTYDNSFELCNYTRGQRTCTSSCSHAVNSCHYGGRTGSAGALAVDFGSEAIGDTIIQKALACGAKSARCENARGINTNCASGSSATHVHVNAGSCDAN